MSELDRLSRLGRAYVGKAKDLFDGETAEQKAMKELDEALAQPMTVQGELNRRAEEIEIRAQLDALSMDEAEIILGVPNKATFNQIKSQYDLLIGHIKEFEAGQPAKRPLAAKERARIERAYAVMTANLDSTDKRFGSLEID